MKWFQLFRDLQSRMLVILSGLLGWSGSEGWTWKHPSEGPAVPRGLWWQLVIASAKLSPSWPISPLPSFFPLLRLSLSPTCWFVCSLFLGNISDGRDCAIHQCLWNPSFYHLYPASFSPRFIPLNFHPAESCVVFPRSWVKFRSFRKGRFSRGKRKDFVFRLFKPIWTRIADSHCLSPFPDAYERLNPVNDCMVPMGECRIVGKGQDCIQAEHNKCWLSGGKCYFLYRTHKNAFTDTVLEPYSRHHRFSFWNHLVIVIVGKLINKCLSGNVWRLTLLTFYS